MTGSLSVMRLLNESGPSVILNEGSTYRTASSSYFSFKVVDLFVPISPWFPNPRDGLMLVNPTSFAWGCSEVLSDITKREAELGSLSVCSLSFDSSATGLFEKNPSYISAFFDSSPSIFGINCLGPSSAGVSSSELGIFCGISF